MNDPTEIPTGLVDFEWFIPEPDYDAMFDDPTDRTVIIEGSVLAIDGVVYDNMEVKIRGGDFARENRNKQGLSFDFASGVDADLPQLVPHVIDEFALSAEWGSNFPQTYVAWEMFDEAGFAPVPGEHVRVQRNGEFYGLFRFTEKLDGTWRDENGIDGEFYKATGRGFEAPRDFEKKQPDDNDFTNINALAAGLFDPPSAAKTDFMFENFDVPNLVNYLAAANLTGHFDSEGQNFYMHLDPTDGWQVHPWDLTNTFGVSAAFNGCGDTSSLWISCNENPLWNSVEDTPELNDMVWRRMRTLLDGPMADGVLEGRFAAYRALISETEISEDESTWNDSSYRTNSQFNLFVDTRRNHFLASNDLPTAQSAAPNIVINEIHHSGNVDFLELFNPTGSAVDMSGWTIEGVIDTVPGGTVVLPGGYAIFTTSIPDFTAEYPSAPNTVLVESGGLKGGGELVQIETPAGTVIDSVEYNSDATWPTEPNTGSVSLSLFDPSDDNASSASWGISVAAEGTPGAANDTVASAADPPPNVVINEIHYNPADGGVEFIELFNAEAATVDISGWDLDGMITFASGSSIPAGGYFVATADLALFQSIYPGVAAVEWAAGEDLKGGGEGVSLETELGITVNDLEYTDDPPWPGKHDVEPSPDGEGPSLELVDHALDNTDGANWQTSLGVGSPGEANEAVPVDSIDPLVTPLSPADGSTVTAGVIDVSGSSFDDLSGVVRVRVRVQRIADVGTLEYWDGTSWAAGVRWHDADLTADGLTWNFPNVTMDQAGQYRVQVVGVDAAGNVSAPSENPRTDFTVEQP